MTFEGITGSSFTGDIAIDDFSLSFGTCPPSKHLQVTAWNIKKKTTTVFSRKGVYFTIEQNGFSSNEFFFSVGIVSNEAHCLNQSLNEKQAQKLKIAKQY